MFFIGVFICIRFFSSVDPSFWNKQMDLMSDDNDSESEDDETSYETETEDDSELDDADKIVNIVSNLDGVEMRKLQK